MRGQIKSILSQDECAQRSELSALLSLRRDVSANASASRSAPKDSRQIRELAG
jgi:hypothetical protein